MAKKNESPVILLREDFNYLFKLFQSSEGVWTEVPYLTPKKMEEMMERLESLYYG